MWPHSTACNSASRVGTPSTHLLPCAHAGYNTTAVDQLESQSPNSAAVRSAGLSLAAAVLLATLAVM